MKTTVEIAEPLLKQLKRYAAARELTMREVIEKALALLFSTALQPKQRFILEDGSVDGRGLSPEFAGVGWEKIRDSIYVNHKG